jgi:Transposase
LGAALQADGGNEVTEVTGLKHQKEKRSMDHFAGLDVSVKETSVCIVDDTGRIVREVRVASEPEDLLQILINLAYHFKRIGLEAGPLSQWLFSALAEAGLPVICVETRHMRAVLKAQINKTDRNDARGIAQMMLVGLYRPVHVKTLRSQKLRMRIGQKQDQERRRRQHEPQRDPVAVDLQPVPSGRRAWGRLGVLDRDVGHRILKTKKRSISLHARREVNAETMLSPWAGRGSLYER